MSTRKQILLVEPDSALRSEAEKTLRQAGHEVVSVDSFARAEGILTVSQFDLAVIGMQVAGKNDTPFYQDWIEEPQRKATPLILLCAANDIARDLPDSAIVRCPFAHDDLLARVNAFLGGAAQVEAPTTAPDPAKESLFGNSDAVDGALDKAFGLDQIDVHESEVRGSTDNSEINTIAKRESLVGYDAEITNITSTQKGTTDTSKIDLAFVQNKLRDMPVETAPVSESARLDVAPLKEELSEKTEAPAPPKEKSAPQKGDHDYEWFASEMDGAKPAAPKAGAMPTPPAPSTLPASNPAEDNVFEWSDPQASNDAASVFSAQMADAIAQRVAEKLVKQLNSDKFAQLVKQEMKAYLKERS